MSMGQQSGRVIVFDTTLRDGEQAPGFSMTSAEKQRVALALADLGVDVIEAGFPAASPGEAEGVTSIARRVQGPVICALARCERGDIETALRALSPARRPRLHTFIATSPIHRRYKLGLSEDEVVARAVAAVSFARRHCDDVEFSAEDASRTEPAFLARVVAAVIEAGATTVNIPDTVGYALPSGFGELIRELQAAVPALASVVLSVHCHDDLGLGVANSLAALEAGARQVECTINGIGERAGNSALEEIVMAIRTHGRGLGLWTGVDTRLLYVTSRLVSRTTGSDVQANKAVVGDNAFSHEAGIHQHGVIANPETYEIMRPADVGFPESRLVLGKHSGRHALRWRFAELGIDLDDSELDAAFAAFKVLADQRKHIREADLEQLAGRSPPRAWQLEDLELTTRAGRAATATLALVHRDGNRVREVAVADRPLGALLRAFERATAIALTPLHCRVRRMPCDDETATEVVLTVAHDGGEHASNGAGADFAEAAALAILEIVNRIELKRARQQAQAIA